MTFNWVSMEFFLTILCALTTPLLRFYGAHNACTALSRRSHCADSVLNTHYLTCQRTLYNLHAEDHSLCTTAHACACHSICFGHAQSCPSAFYAIPTESTLAMPLRCCGDAWDCTANTSAFCTFHGQCGIAVRMLLLGVTEV